MSLLERAVGYFRTSSPSYPILASIEYAVKFPRNPRIERAAARAKAALSALENDDWSKIVLPFGGAADAAEAYLEAHGVYPEFNDGSVLMFYLSPATKVRELKTLVRLARRLPRAPTEASPARMGRASGSASFLSLKRRRGRTCARACGIVPPCVPLIAAGEVITAEKAARLKKARHTFGLTDGRITVYEEE